MSLLFDLLLSKSLEYFVSLVSIFNCCDPAYARIYNFFITCCFADKKCFESRLHPALVSGMTYILLGKLPFESLLEQSVCCTVVCSQPLKAKCVCVQIKAYDIMNHQ